MKWVLKVQLARREVRGERGGQQKDEVGVNFAVGYDGGRQG
jgi:hypothetical protein